MQYVYFKQPAPLQTLNIPCNNIVTDRGAYLHQILPLGTNQDYVKHFSPVSRKKTCFLKTILANHSSLATTHLYAKCLL